MGGGRRAARRGPGGTTASGRTFAGPRGSVLRIVRRRVRGARRRGGVFQRVPSADAERRPIGRGDRRAPSARRAVFPPEFFFAGRRPRDDGRRVGAPVLRVGAPSSPSPVLPVLLLGRRLGRGRGGVERRPRRGSRRGGRAEDGGGGGPHARASALSGGPRARPRPPRVRRRGASDSFRSPARERRGKDDDSGGSKDESRRSRDLVSESLCLGADHRTAVFLVTAESGRVL